MLRSSTLTPPLRPQVLWVLFVLLLFTATCEPYSKKHKTAPSKNQRIIKVQGPPHFNHLYGNQKPYRKRPFGSRPSDEFIRPNHPPPIPPFFNGPSTNHIKHLPRPPPHVFHKSPSYGLGFPYKSFSSYRPTHSKDKFVIQSVSTHAVRPALGSSSGSSAISTSTTYHSPTFTSASFISSSPVSHIISSNDDNGPIREIPAPNLAPKPHVSYEGVLGDIDGIDGIDGVVAGKIHGVGGLGGVGGVHGLGEISGGNAIHGISGIGSTAGIHAVSGVGDISSIASVGGVTNLEPEALLNTIAKNPNGVNLDAIVKDQGVEINTYIKEPSGNLHGNEPTIEIANFDEGSSIDVTGLIKDAGQETSGHHSGYQVTEHHNHLPSNDQIIKGHDGSKLYYAPDPDPSLPVQKVPPTNDPHSTPSNGQNLNNVYLPQVSHGFPYVQAGTLGTPLTSQELFHLMHGYPAVISQPVVAFVSPPQTQGVILSAPGRNYFHQGSESYTGHYPQNEQEENDISHYLQQPEIQHLLHNSPESHHGQEVLGGSHSSVVSQSVYSPQNQPQGYTHQYRTSIESGNSGSESSNSATFPTSNTNHNYQYEPEASESNTRSSLAVIRQTNEGTLTSETVKELLLEDSASNELNQQEKDGTSVPVVLQLKNMPEVPFYASLPSKKAAEALASLQAAGSIASNYMSKVKISRGDQDPEEESSHRRRKAGGGKILDGETLQQGREKTVVEVQQSIPLYETSIPSKNLVKSNDKEDQSTDSESGFSSEDETEQDDYSNLDFKEDESNETFGKRIIPK